MHICFVALNSYNLFGTAVSTDHIGGAETQQHLMARWLVEQGHDVSVITRDHGQPEEEFVDGIRIVRAFDADHGLPFIRFFVPRWSKLVNALRIADADVYYQRGAGFETGQIATWCRSTGKPFVFASASDSDCDRSLPFMSTTRERLLYKIGLRLANAVVVQSHHQANQLESSFGRTGEVIYSSGRILGDPVDPARKGNVVAWVGRLAPEKRFEWLLDIASRCKDFEFAVLGASNDDSPYAKDLLDRASRLPNVRIIGYVPKEEMVSYYNTAKFVLVTSPIEGFPNVFLEAWQLGIPVISSVDPDGIVASNRLGWHIKTVDDAVALLDGLASDATVPVAMAEHVQEYFHRHHTPASNMPRYIEVFQRVVSPE